MIGKLKRNKSYDFYFPLRWLDFIKYWEIFFHGLNSEWCENQILNSDGKYTIKNYG